jgi:transcriptional regulator with XRE-family HTH domain
VITGRQIRAARGFLAWDRRDLAQKAVVTIYAIERIETGGKISGAAMTKALSAIKAALEAEGY